MYKIVDEERLDAVGRQVIAATSLTVHRHYERQLDLVWEYTDKDVMWIGPLITQYITGLDKVIKLLEPENHIPFEVSDEEYQMVYAGEDCCLVVGTLFITADKTADIFLRCRQRVTFFWRVTDEGLKILHMHVSHPYEVLDAGEVFPFRFGKEAYEYIAQTHKLAFLDSLTGIANRNAYENDLMLISKNIPEHHSLGIAIFDLNNLKIINDSQGHLAGDKLISDFARLLREAMPQKVKVYRYGGDEFAAVFMDMAPAAVQTALAQLENARDAYNADNADSPTPINFASGYAFFSPGVDSGLAEMISRADSMLYSNKKAMKRAKAHAKTRAVRHSNLSGKK